MNCNKGYKTHQQRGNDRYVILNLPVQVHHKNLMDFITSEGLYHEPEGFLPSIHLDQPDAFY